MAQKRVILELLEDGYVRGSAKAGNQVDASHLSASEVDNLVKQKKAKRVTFTTVDDTQPSELTALTDQVRQLEGHVTNLEAQLAAAGTLTKASLADADVRTVAERLQSGAWDADTVEALEHAGKQRKGVTDALVEYRKPASAGDGGAA